MSNSDMSTSTWYDSATDWYDAATARFHKVSNQVKARLGPIINGCAPSLEETKQNLKEAEKLVRRARQTSSFVRQSPKIPPQLDRAHKAISRIEKGISKLSKVTGDVSAACEIAAALSILDEWTAGDRTDADAAEAFDKLFGSVARFAEKLPPPLNQYAQILKQISITRFFSNMQRLGHSRAGANTSTPTGRQLHKIMEGIERDSRPGGG